MSIVPKMKYLGHDYWRRHARGVMYCPFARRRQEGCVRVGISYGIGANVRMERQFNWQVWR